ncbi:MAG: cation:proton antiporter [Phycisphaerales bacterium]
MKRGAILLLALAALVAVVVVVRQLASGATIEAGASASSGLGVGMTLGFLLLAGWITGELFRLASLPRISGYLLFGLLAGPTLPQFLGGAAPGALPRWRPLLPASHLAQLHLVDALAIALIALMAGGELRIDLIRRTARAVFATIASSALMVFVLVGAVVFVATDLIGSMPAMRADAHLFVCVVIAAFAISNSPAVVIAVLKETRARGPMQALSLAGTIAKDMLLVAVVTAIYAVGVNVLAPDVRTGSGASRVLGVAWHLLGSIGLGAIVGAIVRVIIARVTIRMEIVVVALALATALVATSLGLAPLLVGLAAGFVLSNLWPQQSSPLFRSIGDIMLPVSVVFFANIGATLDLFALALVWPMALTIMAARLVGVWSGVTIGTRLGGVAPPARTWAWTAFVPQAGVSLALATEFRHTFGAFDWSHDTYVLLVALIALHELVGPPLFRFGLARCNEIRE